MCNIMAFFAVMLFSCENNIKEVKSFISIDSINGIIAYDVVFVKSDSGNVITELKAPLMHNTEGDTGSLEFPKGFFATMFDKEVPSTTISAKYGVNYPNKDVVFARDSVVIINLITQETLYTERLYWFRRLNLIRTGTTVTITSPDKFIVGDSLIADDKFVNRTLYGIHATLEMDSI